MAAPKPSWSNPSAILFASELPANEKAFGIALAQAAESGADLLIFHAYESLEVGASQASVIRCFDIAAACATRHCFEPLAERARNLRIHCMIVVRHGSPADQILAFLRGRKIDRVVMGAHSPGPVGIVGPNVVEGSFRNVVTRKVLCDVSKQQASRVVANFGAQLAARYNAR